MPHIVVKLYAGRSEQDKQALADRLGDALIQALGGNPDKVSIAIEDVAPEQWMAEVYMPDIAGRQDSLYKRPRYGPLHDA